MIRLDILDTHFRNRITDSPLDVIGQITLPVNIGNFQSHQIFIVVRTLTVACLLGADYLVAHDIVINYKQGIVEIKGHNIPFTLCYDQTATGQYLFYRLSLFLAVLFSLLMSPCLTMPSLWIYLVFSLSPTLLLRCQNT